MVSPPTARKHIWVFLLMPTMHCISWSRMLVECLKHNLTISNLDYLTQWWVPSSKVWATQTDWNRRLATPHGATYPPSWVKGHVIQYRKPLGYWFCGVEANLLSFFFAEWLSTKCGNTLTCWHTDAQSSHKMSWTPAKIVIGRWTSEVMPVVT